MRFFAVLKYRSIRLERMRRLQFEIGAAVEVGSRLGPEPEPEPGLNSCRIGLVVRLVGQRGRRVSEPELMALTEYHPGHNGQIGHTVGQSETLVAAWSAGQAGSGVTADVLVCSVVVGQVVDLALVLE
jgi:hypothetical protein